MPRPKKDGEKVSLYLDKKTMERIRAYADEKGQTLTVAIERALSAFLDESDKKTHYQTTPRREAYNTFCGVFYCHYNKTIRKILSQAYEFYKCRLLSTL